ncbi:MAG: Eco47II family restriction endonuclease [Muribaculaceae bacterium]|nr:Eco47II family restriction endonuclease [Muribaculaceae bacterium]
MRSTYNLGFISDNDIFNHVKNTVKKFRDHIDLKQFNQNIIDPIKLSFDAEVYGRSIEEVVNQECFRQIDKSNTNTIGYFHQYLFKAIGNGWKVPKKGFDIINEQQHIFVEIKNKHNTMNSSSAKNTYIRMQSKILDDDEAVCYLVEVISTKSKNEPWVITIDNEQKKHKKIRRMSVDRFYEIVFGEKDAFYKLCKVLPTIIKDVISETNILSLENSVYDELKSNHSDLLTSLYLLAFSKYEGFEKLKI